MEELNSLNNKEESQKRKCLANYTVCDFCCLFFFGLLISTKWFDSDLSSGVSKSSVKEWQFYCGHEQS